MKLPYLAAIAVVLSPTLLRAQSPVSTYISDNNVHIDRNIFNHMDVGISLGSTGIGLDVSTNVTDWVRLRAGIDYMLSLQFL